MVPFEIFKNTGKNAKVRFLSSPLVKPWFRIIQLAVTATLRDRLHGCGLQGLG
jgi:hypothetical protein